MNWNSITVDTKNFYGSLSRQFEEYMMDNGMSDLSIDTFEFNIENKIAAS